MRVGLEPLAGSDLEFLNELGHRQGSRQGHEKMHMVRHTADTVELAALIVDESEDIGVKLPLVVLCYGRDAAMGAKYDMIECLCVTHAILTKTNTDYCNPSPRRGDTHTVHITPYKRSAVWWTTQHSAVWWTTQRSAVW